MKFQSIGSWLLLVPLLFHPVADPCIQARKEKGQYLKKQQSVTWCKFFLSLVILNEMLNDKQ